MPDRRSPTITRRTFLGGVATIGAAALVGCGSTKVVASTVVRDPIAYGEGPSRTGVLSTPQIPGPRPVIVLIHGGYWSLGIDHVALEPLADNLAQAGYAVWNIDYRRVGEGGGWPATFDDVATAVDELATLARDRPLDVGHVGVIGHSAGGELAMWAAARRNMAGTAGDRWARPAVSPVAAVSLAGVLDLEMAADATGSATNVVKLRSSVVSTLGGTPTEVPDRYAVASPIERLPLALPQLLVHGAKDDIVPIGQSRAYVAAAARTSDRVRLIELPAADHADLIRVDQAGWFEVVNWVRANVGDPRPVGS